MTGRWSDLIQLRIWLAEVETRSPISRNALDELIAKNVFGRKLASGEGRTRPLTAIAAGSRPHAMERIVDFLATMPELSETAWLYRHPFWKLLNEGLPELEFSNAVEGELARLGLRRLHVTDSIELQTAVANRRFESMFDDALRKRTKWLESSTRVMLLAIMCGEAASVGAAEVLEPLRRALDLSLQNTQFGASLWNGRLDIYEEVLDACQHPRFSTRGNVDDRAAISYRARSLLISAKAHTAE